ncbi:MAG: GTPase [archaeon]
MQFYSIESPEKLVEQAFTHARKNALGKRTRKSAIQNRKDKVLRKMELFYEYLDKQLNHMEISVPRIDKMSLFYQELLPETIQVGKVKQAASQIVSVRKLLKKQLIQAKKSIYKPAPDAIEHMRKETARYFGRCASIMKSLKANFEVLKEANHQLKEVPDIRTDIPTLVFAGFPNTGKTTLLTRITKSKAKIAAYPFTTKSLQLGYFSLRYREIQAMDTPGLLDQINREWNPIEKKALSGLKHLATCIVFVIDPTPRAGYSLEQQHQLYENLRKQFTVPFVQVINKCDVATDEQVQAAQALFGMDAVREGEGMESTLKDKLWRALGFAR